MGVGSSNRHQSRAGDQWLHMGWSSFSQRSRYCWLVIHPAQLIFQVFSNSHYSCFVSQIEQVLIWCCCESFPPITRVYILFHSWGSDFMHGSGRGSYVVGDRSILLLFIVQVDEVNGFFGCQLNGGFQIYGLFFGYGNGSKGFLGCTVR